MTRALTAPPPAIPRLPWEQSGGPRDGAFLAEVLLFLDTGCQGGLKRISRERVRPLRGSAHVALAVSEGQTTLRGCGGRGAAWPLTASEGQGLDPLETG